MSDQMLLVVAIVAAIAIVVLVAAFVHSRRLSHERGSLLGPDYERLLHGMDDHRHGERGAGAMPLRH
jgi:hypothetical protein